MAAEEARPEIAAAKCSQYQDYRQMLDKYSFDGLFVATTTHARVLICLDAMQAGLDVYAEKPLTLTIEEGQYPIKAERKYNTVFQVGSQQRLHSHQQLLLAATRSATGAIGKVHTVLCPNLIGPERRTSTAGELTPEGMNWDMWCHQDAASPLQLRTSSRPRPLGPPSANTTAAGWAGGVTGWGTHALDQVCSGPSEPTTPTPSRSGPRAPAPISLSLRYPSGTVLKLSLPGRVRGPGWGRSSSATRARSRSTAIASPAIRPN